MTAPMIPQSEAELTELVASAVSNGQKFSIRGGGTRGHLGGTTNATPLSTSGLTGITLYEPAEMVISARAGTPLEEVEATLARNGQMLPFEPMDHRHLLGSRGIPTIGAIAACNISGPRRVTAGAARDHLIGVRLVNGRAEIIKSGGRVMKNVTGLDLVKLNAGAFGTLGILTEVTFKVLPRPEASVTLCIDDLAVGEALVAMAEAMATPFEVNAAAFVERTDDTPSQTLLRIEGFAESCTYRSGRLMEQLSKFGTGRRIDSGDAIWKQIRDVEDIASPDYSTILRIHVAPSRARTIVEFAAENDVRPMVDWGGGLIWLGIKPGTDVADMARRVAALGGHPMVVRSTDDLLEVFQPANPTVAELGRRVKAAFDPKGIFNPGFLAGHI